MKKLKWLLDDPRRWGPLSSALLCGVLIFGAYIVSGSAAQVAMLIGLLVGLLWMGWILTYTQRWHYKRSISDLNSTYVSPDFFDKMNEEDQNGS